MSKYFAAIGNGLDSMARVGLGIIVLPLYYVALFFGFIAVINVFSGTSLMTKVYSILFLVFIIAPLVSWRHRE